MDSEASEDADGRDIAEDGGALDMEHAALFCTRERLQMDRLWGERADGQAMGKTEDGLVQHERC